MFQETAYVRRKLRAEQRAQLMLGAMALLIVIPLLMIVVYLVVKAMPSLSIGFLLEPPRELQTRGGIWPALVGTVYLVVVSLLIAAPVGVLAAVYLNEYARDNWANRMINLAVINLAGVPSIVHALFGLGAFVLAARLGQSVLAASLTLAVMTLPGDHRQHARSAGRSATELPRSVLECRGHTVADDSRGGPAQCD